MPRRFLAGLAAILIGAIFIGVGAISFLMDARDPKVALVATTKDWVPDIAFEVASIPLAIASLIKYRRREFALLPATAANLEKTLGGSEFLIVGVHGFDGFIYSEEKKKIAPPVRTNFAMRHIYFGSCYFGARRSEWQRSFPNANLIGHDGETYATTSGFYLFFKAPLDLLRE